MKRKISDSVIAKVQSLGFDVYMRSPDDTWLLFVDGDRIGYLQCGHFGGYSLSTVHKPNRTTGTGFQILVDVDLEGLDRDALERALVSAPHWANGPERQSVSKWKGIDEYRAGGLFNAEYKLVEKKEKVDD